MKPTIALFLHQPKCSVQSGNGIIKALHSHYRFKIFTKHEVEDDFFDDVDMVAVPGGIGDSDTYSYLMKNNDQKIRNFIASGGRYLGICMGAYWADNDYLAILNGVRAVQYIKQPNTDTRRPHAKSCKISWEEEQTEMFFYDGAAFVKDTNYNIPVLSDFETIATYANGDPMAIIQQRIGLIGCHPEADKHWYDSYSWMQPKWQGGQHRYLLNFVNYLMTK